MIFWCGGVIPWWCLLCQPLRFCLGETSVMLARDFHCVFSLFSNINRLTVSLNQLSSYIIFFPVARTYFPVKFVEHVDVPKISDSHFSIDAVWSLWLMLSPSARVSWCSYNLIRYNSAGMQAGKCLSMFWMPENEWYL